MGLFESFAQDLMLTFVDEEEYTSLPTDRANTIYERYSFTNYVSPIGFKPEDGYYECHDGFYGVVFECTPRIRAGAEAAMAFESILKKLPENAFLQVQLMGSSNIHGIIEQWEFDHLKRDNEVLREAIRLMADYFRKKTTESITPSMRSKLKRHRLVISIKHNNLEQLLDTAKSTFNYMGANHFSPRLLKEEQLLPIFFEFLNPHVPIQDMPKYQRGRRYFNRQCASPDQSTRVHDGGIEFGKKVDGKIQGKAWKNLVIADLPDEAFIGDMGKKIGEAIEGAINENQFRDNFIITWMVQRVTKRTYDKIEKVQTVINKVRAKEEDRSLHEKKAEAYGVLKKLDHREPLFRFDMIVSIAGDTPDLAEENATSVETFWRPKPTNIKIVSGDAIQAPLFQCALPLGITNEYFEKVQNNPFYLFSEQVVQFLPIETDWMGNRPHILGVTRRGCLFAVDLFATDESKNFVMYGTSGAGKSATASFILFLHYARGGRAFIIDVGDSYGGLVQEFGGVYLQPDKKNPVSFNPFGDIGSRTKLNEYLQFLISFIYAIGGNKEELIFKREQKFIKGKLEEVIPDLWEDCNKSGEIMSIGHIRDAFAESDDKRLADFAVHLKSYCPGGVNEAFFTGKPSFNFNHDLVALDTTKIKDDKELTEALIFVASYFFSEAVYQGDGTQELLFWIDEFHKHMGKNQNMDEEVEEAYRTYRKHNGAVGIGTQGLTDLIDPSSGEQKPIGKVVLTNSAWTLVGKQKEVARNLVVSSGLYDFSPEDEKALKAMGGIDGEYKEFLIISPDERKTYVRWIYNPFFLKLISTKPEEKAEILHVKRELNISRTDAIKLIIQNEGRQP